jgi:hypothetical protein
MQPIIAILTGDGKNFYLVTKVGSLKAIIRSDRKVIKAIEARDIIEGLVHK